MSMKNYNFDHIPAPDTENKRIIVAMSGGVDSSVAAWLLKERGWDPIGVFMRSGPQQRDPSKFSKGCCGVEDSLDARRVCDRLGMPFYAANFEEEFNRIVEYFVDEYHAGRTPNPCVQCNRWIKFGILLDFARDLDAVKIATGHYARLDFQEGRYRLSRAVDDSKDQTYVLFPLSQEQLASTVLPLGNFQKSEIRELAKFLDLRVHNKADSVEICFVPEDNYRLVLQDRSPGKIKVGNFLDHAGAIIGQHSGHQNFTIGQRRGLGMTFGVPMYVKSLHADSNTVVLGEDKELFQGTLRANDLNWMAVSAGAMEDGRVVQAQIRYNSTAEVARLFWENAETVRVEFENPQRAITPGQAVVFYDRDVVLGGGWIIDAK